MVKKGEFQKLVSAIKPSSFTDYRLYLRKVYEVIKEKAEQYSYIMFTASCGLGETNAMYLHINSGRPLTLKTARKIATGLGLTGNQRSYFLKLVEYQGGKTSEERNKAFQSLLAIKAKCLSGDWDKQKLDFFNCWYHSVIYEILRLSEAKDDPEWLAKNLKPAITAKKVRESLSLLEKLQMIQYDEGKDRLVPTELTISTGSEIRGMVFKGYHNQMIDLALKALSTEEPSNRDISSVTVGVPLSAMGKVKELTAKFRKEILELASELDEKEQILQVNIQAFPLSAEIKKRKGD